MWWEHFRMTRQDAQEALPEADRTELTWDEFRSAFRAEFMPHNYECSLWNQLHSLQQKHSIHEYIAEFQRLLLLLPTINNADLVQRFIRGLKCDTATEVDICGPTTLAEAETIALRYDDIRFSTSRQSSH